MHWFECILLVTILCAVHGIDSENQTEAKNDAANIATIVDPEENKINFQITDSATVEPVFTEKAFPDSIANFTETFLTGFQNLSDNVNATDLSDGQVQLKTSQKRDVENGSLNDITPLLLFPILPFLFPPKEDKMPPPEQNEVVPSLKNDSKINGNPGVKPFILFDFAFNIRRIPLKNKTERSSDSKLANGTNSDSNAEDSLQKPDKSRRRRNTHTRVDPLRFFDDSPLFPDSELDEFLPKPDLFFPDLPFHHKLVKKLIRKKRDQKKPDLKSDFKMFIDTFDEAFMKTKREVERTDPFLNILREAEQSFDEDRKEPEDLFNPISVLQEKPRVKWGIQRNIKRLKNDHHDDLTKMQESPMIILDKVVKIGEFHVHDDGHDKDKLKKKRNTKESKKIFLGSDSHDFMSNEDSEGVPKSIFELIKQEESKKEKRNHHQQHEDSQSKEVRISPQKNISSSPTDGGVAAEPKSKATEMDSQATNGSSMAVKYGNLLKVIDSLKSKIKVELQNSGALSSPAEKLKSKGSYYEKVKRRPYDDLKKNVTELIQQFLAVVKEFDDTQLMEKLEVSERDDAGDFDWTEKETLQNSDTYLLRKDPMGRRQKKDAEIEKEFVEFGKKERQVSDLNYLFLTVTLPTVFVFALVLLVCFFNLQIKGKICTKLFRPRQILLVEDEAPSQFVYKNPTGAKKI